MHKLYCIIIFHQKSVIVTFRLIMKTFVSCRDSSWTDITFKNEIFLFFSQTGKFFGEAEGAVMSKLLQMGSFKR